MSQQILQLRSERHLHNQCLLVQVALGVRLTQLLCFGIGCSNAVSKANTVTSVQHCGGSGLWCLIDLFPPHLRCTRLALTSCPTPPHWCRYSQLDGSSPSSLRDFTRAKAMIPARVSSHAAWRASSWLHPIVSQLNTFLDSVCMHSLQYLIRDWREASY